jgi:putative phosphoribosyl transferase
MISEKINFKNLLGFDIYGDLYIPENVDETIPVVVFADGSNSSRENPTSRRLSDELGKRGIASLLFDFTGQGESGGTTGDSTITQQSDDLTNAIHFIKSQNRFHSVGIYGETTGGTVAMRVTASEPFVKALVLNTPRVDADSNVLYRIEIPTLIIQGSADLEVRPESREIFDRISGKKHLEIIAGAGHTLDEKPEYFEKAIEVTCNWFFENLPRAMRTGA